MLFWHRQVSDLLPIGCLVVVSDHCCVVCKLNDGFGVMPGHAVVGEQGVQDGLSVFVCLSRLLTNRKLGTIRFYLQKDEIIGFQVPNLIGLNGVINYYLVFF